MCVFMVCQLYLKKAVKTLKHLTALGVDEDMGCLELSYVFLVEYLVLVHWKIVLQFLRKLNI